MGSGFGPQDAVKGPPFFEIVSAVVKVNFESAVISSKHCAQHIVQ
jgi:hypothetical protein